jgi:putative endonuclease
MFRRWVAWLAARRPRRPLGEQGERAAEKYLKRRGYKIVAARDRTALGELDLVAVDGRTVVFVEVKTRQSHEAGHPVEAVDAAKQARLTRLALAFLKRHDLLECAARFDVVAITWQVGSGQPKIEHFVNAFEAVGRGQMFS